MRSVMSLIAAAAASLSPSIFTSATFAADMPIAPPPYAPVVEDFGGWYLRGDIGFSNQRVRKLDSNAAFVFPQTADVGLGFGSVPLFWAAHGGLDYKVSPSVTLELAYSYIDLGSARPGVFTLTDGTTGASSPVTRNITSHDLKFGARWNLENPAVYAPPPMIGKG